MVTVITPELLSQSLPQDEITCIWEKLLANCCCIASCCGFMHMDGKGYLMGLLCQHWLWVLLGHRFRLSPMSHLAYALGWIPWPWMGPGAAGGHELVAGWHQWLGQAWLSGASKSQGKLLLRASQIGEKSPHGAKTQPGQGLG